MQKILPSIHLLEIFSPVVANERFFIDEVVAKIPSIPFYKGIEMGIIHDVSLRKKVRKIVEENGYQLTVWISPDLNEKGFDLSSLNSSLRIQSLKMANQLIDLAVEMGATHCGIPCGPYKGEEYLADATNALCESYLAMLDHVEKIEGTDLTFEPLDRYASKKMLLGPIDEVVSLFKELRKRSGKIFIHWDTAHEVLNGADLLQSLKKALPYVAQIHLCNCVPDRDHPYYGDWHMDVGRAPDFRNWGFLDADIASKILMALAEADKAEGVNNTFCAVEIRTYKGNDLWACEENMRRFMHTAFDKAGILYEE